MQRSVGVRARRADRTHVGAVSGRLRRGGHVLRRCDAAHPFVSASFTVGPQFGARARQTKPLLYYMYTVQETSGARRKDFFASQTCVSSGRGGQPLRGMPPTPPLNIFFTIIHWGCLLETAPPGTTVRTALCLSRARCSSPSAPANLKLGEPTFSHVNCSDPNRQLLGRTHLMTVRACLNGAGERGVDHADTATSACLLVSW